MIIYQIKIQRDTDNSYTDGEFVELYDNGNTVKLCLKNPDRDFEISYNDFLVVCEAIQLLRTRQSFELAVAGPEK